MSRPAGHARAWRPLALTLLALPWSAGCYALIRAELGNPIPGASAVASLEPGRTTRSEVLARLGPPDEYGQPAVYAELAVADSRATRVFEEHDLFHRTAYTWVRERRDDRAWLLWPFYLNVANESRVDRLKVLFDDAGIVSAVGVERGIDAP